MEALVGLYAPLRLRVNVEKSAVARVWDRQFLGFSFWVASGSVVKRRVAPKALRKMKERVREMTSRTGGRSLVQVVRTLRSYLVGWRAYFRLAATPAVFVQVGSVATSPTAHAPAQAVEAGTNDVSRVATARCSGRGTRHRRSLWPKLVACGGPQSAPDRSAGQILRFTRRSTTCSTLTSTHRTAGCGPACPVVWEGSRRAFSPTPYPDFSPANPQPATRYPLLSASIGSAFPARRDGMYEATRQQSITSSAPPAKAAGS